MDTAKIKIWNIVGKAQTKIQLKFSGEWTRKSGEQNSCKVGVKIIIFSIKEESMEVLQSAFSFVERSPPSACVCGSRTRGIQDHVFRHNNPQIYRTFYEWK